MFTLDVKGLGPWKVMKNKTWRTRSEVSVEGAGGLRRGGDPANPEAKRSSLNPTFVGKSSRGLSDHRSFCV